MHCPNSLNTIIMASLAPKTDVLGRRLAAHLLRRTTYNVSKERIDEFALLTPDAAVDQLIDTPASTIYPEPIHAPTGEYFINCGTMPPSCTPSEDVDNEGEYILAWWLYNALQDNSSHYKFQFFLHTCFTVDASSANDAGAGFDHLYRLAYYSAGSYKDFALRMSIDRLMLTFLNGNENTVASPNENYAREFFELFTIGKGPQDGPDSYTNYTESDIVEAAKVFSGWVAGPRGALIDPDLNVPVGTPQYAQHDTTTKTFSDKFGSASITGAVDAYDMVRELQDLVNMVFDQDETARFICRKIYRYFVSDRITTEIETDIIEPLAATLRDNDYDLSFAFKELFKSVHFYDEDDSDSSDEIIGSKLRDPISHVLQTLSMLGLPTYDPFTEANQLYNQFLRINIIGFLLGQMGMIPFVPPSVAGYPSDYQEPNYSRLWFDGSTAISRYKFGEMLLLNQKVIAPGNFGGVQFNPISFIQSFCSDPYDASTIVQEVTDYFLPESPGTNRFDYLLNTIFLDGLPAYDWTYEWNNYITSGDPDEVYLMLFRFFKSVLYTGEYQMM